MKNELINEQQPPLLLVVSGLSGSGKTVALRSLEDMGFYCIDNLPISLLPQLAESLITTPETFGHRLAVGIDVRSHSSDLKHIPAFLKEYRSRGIRAEIFYFLASRNCLIKRFSETRRPHPLASPSHTLEESIAEEIHLMDAIATSADLITDTTKLSVHNLRELMWQRLGKSTPGLSLMVQSFGFKKGVPSDADYVFDVRCLPNPYWEPDLRPFTGKDTCIQQYLENQGSVVEMLSEILEFISKQIPRMQAAQRSYLTIAIGCTGGKHRSVFMAEQLAKQLQRKQYDVLVNHRQITDPC